MSTVPVPELIRRMAYVHGLSQILHGARDADDDDVDDDCLPETPYMESVRAKIDEFVDEGGVDGFDRALYFMHDEFLRLAEEVTVLDPARGRAMRAAWRSVPGSRPRAS